MRERRQPRERRVRQRLLAALLVCAVTVLAAAAPGVALAVRDLSRAQDRADAAQLTTRATVLAHSLADERDDLAAFAADGRPRWVLGSMGPGTKLPTLGHAPYGVLRDGYEANAAGL
ncbi:hypothetical protein, partial [Streptomyces sp. CBMA29]|uniref:hypothetical protein n=1 Tax=Streptomyces sp. CBMA29 TaxID=1896314 RepID=UPI001661B5C9